MAMREAIRERCTTGDAYAAAIEMDQDRLVRSVMSGMRMYSARLLDEELIGVCDGFT